MKNRFLGNGEIRPGRKTFFHRSKVGPQILPPPAEEKKDLSQEVGELITEDILTIEQLPSLAPQTETIEIVPVSVSDDILLEEQPKKKKSRLKKA
jgi:hypothetical protein